MPIRNSNAIYLPILNKNCHTSNQPSKRIYYLAWQFFDRIWWVIHISLTKSRNSIFSSSFCLIHSFMWTLKIAYQTLKDVCLCVRTSYFNCIFITTTKFFQTQQMALKKKVKDLTTFFLVNWMWLSSNGIAHVYSLNVCYLNQNLFTGFL